jgi:hypothetical protein
MYRHIIAQVLLGSSPVAVREVEDFSEASHWCWRADLMGVHVERPIDSVPKLLKEATRPDHIHPQA